MADADEKRDLTKGIAASELDGDRMILGRVGEDEVLVVKRGAEIFAIGAHCTHYKGPLAEGLLVSDTVRCPWHHACFSLRTGEAVRAPALDPVARWRVETSADGNVVVREKISDAAASKRPSNGGSSAWP